MNIPKEVKQIADRLSETGYQVYLVGGCLRDLLLEREPKDWDIATDAKPEEVQKLFKDSVYENNFGTVGVKTDSENPTLKIVEVTTLRKEGKYTDKRHPDSVSFAKNIEEDLARRDFTVNAIAFNLTSSKDLRFSDDRNIVDPFGGKKDLKDRTIRAVGDPEKRFEEDALRLMRAVRFAAQLNFAIEPKTAAAIKNKDGLLEFVSKERTRDEFCKLLMTGKAAEGVRKMLELGLLKIVIPELVEGVGVEQNKHHVYDVFEHNLRSLEYAVEKNHPLDARLSALLHDVGKPKSRRWQNDPAGPKAYQGKKGDWTFYGHQVVGEKMVLKIMDRLRFSKELTEKVALLVREHMFVYDPEAVTLKGVRRILNRVGQENIDDLIRLREADRIGSGVPKAQPYRLRYLQAMIEKVKKDPVGPKMLKINGEDVMKILKTEPGPKIGAVLAVLLEEVLDNPKLNEKKKLEARVKALGKLSEKELAAMRAKAQKAAAQAQERIDEEVKKKYFVR